MHAACDEDISAFTEADRKGFSEKQQSVICGIVREIPQHRMAQSLGVNESRISQIKNESLDAMRSIARKQVA